MLRDVAPGSIVVLDECGVRSIVELGALLGENPKKKKLAWSALVHDVDDQTLRPTAPRTARCVEPDLEVVHVVASVYWLRRMRDVGARVRQAGGGAVRDPLQADERQGEAF